MVQGYYTIEESANILGMEAEKLNQMAQRREIRAFADKGTWRFRTQDVEEMARRMGIGSDPELQMGEVSSKKSSGKLPKSKPKTAGDDLFEFELSGSDDDLSVELDDPGAVRKKTTGAAGAAGGKTGKKATDADEFFEFELSGDSNSRLDVDEAPLRSPSLEDEPIGFQEPGSGRTNKTSLPAAKGKTNIAGAQSKVKRTGMADADGGPQLDEDGFPIPQSYSGRDSDVKLNPVGDLPATEEVLLDDLDNLDDLDAQLERAQDSGRNKKSSGKLGAPPKPADLDAGSPFELSEDDLDLDLDTSSTKKIKKAKPAPPPDDDDDEVSLGDLSLGDGDFSGSSGASGINLHLPADTGINLERAASDGNDEVEFELSLDGEGDDLVTGPSTAKGLGKVSADADASSEFELTLDDEGGLKSLDEDGLSDSSTAEGEEKDIFETDFEIPALDDESASEVAAIDDADTDLESSDFEFDPSADADEEEDSASQVVAIDDEEDSASQVVAIDEEDSDSGSVVVNQEEESEELDDMTAGMPDEDEEEEEELVPAGAALPPARWGALPVIFMLPCVVVMSLLSLMTFELLHGMRGYRPASPGSTLVLKPVADLFGQETPKD